jgi:uncharacterized protein (DUF1778 family)
MKKEKHLRLPVSEEQEKKIKEAAEKIGMTTAGFLRFVALEKAKEINKEK